MRENRTYGSEGGEGKPFPTPISTPQLAGAGRPGGDTIRPPWLLDHPLSRMMTAGG